MKVLVCGTRGIPDILGGVETHCEALFPILVKQGHAVDLVRRSAYINNDDVTTSYKGVKLIDLYSPKKKSFEAIVHSALVVFYAKKKGYKYIHMHAIGPSLVIPLARLLGLKVIMTHHGPDYDRQKWGKMAKSFLKLGEWCAAKFANEIIVISETINSILKEKYDRHDAHLIHNGVKLPQKSKDTAYIESLGLAPKKYIIAVGRFVPEKGFHDLIDAYKIAHIDHKLVLVGDADHESDYSIALKKQANENGVILTGFIKGEKLNEIFSHAALFAMPSYHEGLPIALLEAMSYNLKLVVSDIPANLEVEIEDEAYFETGNVEMLANKMKAQLELDQKINYHQVLKGKYEWSGIAQQTAEVYARFE